MCRCDSEGPVVIREKRERARRKEQTNSRPWQRLGGRRIGIEGLQVAKGLGWHIGQQMERGILAMSEHVLGLASSEAAGLGLEVQEDGI